VQTIFKHTDLNFLIGFEASAAEWLGSPVLRDIFGSWVTDVSGQPVGDILKGQTFQK
jgi:hypothetical protein